jgi:hypothetical protein
MKGLKDHAVFRLNQGGTTERVKPSSLGAMGMKAFLFLQAAEKAFPLRSQSFEPLNVPHAYVSRFSLLTALPEGIFEQFVTGGQT